MNDELHELNKQVGKTLGFKPRISWEILNAAEDATMIGFEREAEARKWWDEHPSVHDDYHIGTLEIWPLFSKDIASAMMVVEKMRELYDVAFLLETLDTTGDCNVELFRPDDYGKVAEATEKSLPLAICRAALQAVKGDGE